MSIIAWLVLGLVAGFIASKIVNKPGEGVILDMVLGIVGAFVGGAVNVVRPGTPVTRFNIYSAIIATVGAIVVLAAYHAISEHPTA